MKKCAKQGCNNTILVPAWKYCDTCTRIRGNGKKSPTHMWKCCDTCTHVSKEWSLDTYVHQNKSECTRRHLSEYEYTMLLALVENGISIDLIACALDKPEEAIVFALAPEYNQVAEDYLLT